MHILYLGDNSKHTTSYHRAEALRRLGHDVTHLHPRSILPKLRLIGGMSTRCGYALFTPAILHFIQNKVRGMRFDFVWVDGGAEIGPMIYRWLKQEGMRIINYNVDDPFGRRDGKKWSLYLAGVPYHDLTTVVRKENIQEAKTIGATKVVRVYRSYDPVAHAPVELTELDQKEWRSDVSFIGTWMPERGPFMKALIEEGVPLTIRGNRWQKAPEWETIRQVWKGPAVYGTDFVKAIQCSKVTLGLLSKGNRDLHTTRSAEVPFVGGAAFCAERTSEHASMFEEGKEIVLWSDAQECAQCCEKLLSDHQLQRSIVDRAKTKIIQLGLSNDKVLQMLLDMGTADMAKIGCDIEVFGVE